MSDPLSFPVKILYLTRDLDLLRRQLEGHPLTYETALPLMDNVSTDEIAPAHAGYYYDERLASFALTGLRGGAVGMDALRQGGFTVIVAGRSKGCGSSRETAPYAEQLAGVRVVFAESFEKIYRQNCQNIGLATSTDLSLLARLEAGDILCRADFTEGLDPLSADIVEHGGLFAYTRLRLEGRLRPPSLGTGSRRMTMVEKIIAGHAVTGRQEDALGVVAVKPGDAVFVRADVRFSHDYVTAMAEAQFHAAFGPEARVFDPGSAIAFRDHLTFLDRVIPETHVRLGMREQAASLAETQRQFARHHGIRLYDEVRRGDELRGSHGICHVTMLEEVALPGQVVVGTDSHTCTAGALGCLAFGVGSTDMANAWRSSDVRITVPETVRVLLRGRLSPSVCAKDVLLYLLGLDFIRSGGALGKVIEYAGEGLEEIALDERATLTNMAVEAGGITGIIEPDDRVLGELARRRGVPSDSVRDLVVVADEGATYSETVEVHLDRLEPMLATPGDPKNAVALSALGRSVPIDIAYGGSCTGGKQSDMDLYARVIARALEQGRRVAPGVALYIQFGSQKVRRYAEERGYTDLFRAVGATLIDPSCGACIRAGPGVSERAEQVTVSAMSRNFPGRSGPGQVYLASPLVVAASAIIGMIAGPDAI